MTTRTSADLLPDWFTMSALSSALVVPLADGHMRIVAAEPQSAADMLLVERMQAVQAEAVLIGAELRAL